MTRVLARAAWTALALCLVMGSAMGGGARDAADDGAEAATPEADRSSERPLPKLPGIDLEGVSPDDLHVEMVYCSCSDQPVKHFPYSVALFMTPRGDVVARPERQELSVTFTPLAVRFGERYCDVDAHQNCYGTFSHPCEFTDFRYGPYLQQFFPTCKSDDAAVEPSQESR